MLWAEFGISPELIERYPDEVEAVLAYLDEKAVKASWEQAARRRRDAGL